MHGSRPFIIYTAGRSRTAWLSRFLTYRDWTCKFEEVIKCPSVNDIPAVFGPNTGSAETAAALLWRSVEQLVPGIRRVVVRRPEKEIIQSFILAVPETPWARLVRNIRILNLHLDQISRLPGTLTVNFSDLQYRHVARAVWHHCLPYPWDESHWKDYKYKVIEVDVKPYIEYVEKHGAQIGSLLAAAGGL